MRKKIWFLLTFLCMSGFCNAQQVVSSGGFAKQSDASIVWIIGGSLSDISGVDLNYLSGDQVKQLRESAFDVNIFPNPSSGLLNIEIAQSDTGRLVLEIFDLKGRVLINRSPVKETLTQLDIGDLAEGAYYLKIAKLNDDKLYRIEKIIKVNK